MVSTYPRLRMSNTCIVSRQEANLFNKVLTLLFICLKESGERSKSMHGQQNIELIPTNFMSSSFIESESLIATSILILVLSRNP